VGVAKGEARVRVDLTNVSTDPNAIITLSFRYYLQTEGDYDGQTPIYDKADVVLENVTGMAAGTSLKVASSHTAAGAADPAGLVEGLASGQWRTYQVQLNAGSLLANNFRGG